MYFLEYKFEEEGNVIRKFLNTAFLEIIFTQIDLMSRTAEALRGDYYRIKMVVNS